MPVDLSNIGLEGQQAYATRMATLAQADSMRASAAHQDMEVEQAQRMQQLSDAASRALADTVNRTPSTGADPQSQADAMESYADPIDTVANVLMKGGAVQAGAELMTKAAEIRAKESNMRKDDEDIHQKRLENIIKGADIAGRKLGQARNQSEWEQGLREVEEAGVIEPHLMAQLKGMQYDPDIAAYFHAQSITAADNARIEIQQRNAAAAERARMVAASQRARALEVSKARLKEQQHHNSVMEKARGHNGGATPVLSPQTLNMAKTSLLTSDTFKDADMTDPGNMAAFAAASNYVASQAQTLVRENKGIDWDTATQQAVMRAEASGAFKTMPATSGFMGTGLGADGKKVQFDSKGLKKETALSLPPGLKPQDAAKSLKKGKWYNTVRGPAKWNGSAWEQ
jgi:hypothetical protein